MRLLRAFPSLRAIQQMGSHVVGHVDGVQLVSQEPVTQVHALLLAPGVDGDDADVDHDHHADDEVVFLQNHVGDQRDQVQGLLF